MSSPLAAGLEGCLGLGGVAVFPADTVYGLACDPESSFAVQRLYLLKRRSLEKPSAVMFFDLERALAALPELGARTREALGRLLPGPVGVLLANPAGRFPLACGADVGTLGLRVPLLEDFADVPVPVLQSSANRAGGADPCRLEDVPELLRAGADLVIDGGELPGAPSTVVDLRHYEEDGAWSIVRAGAVSEAALVESLWSRFHFESATYGDMIKGDIPAFDRFQDEVAAASGEGAKRVLELGIGTGETARRLLARHPDASLVGVDANESMLAAARAALPPARARLRVARLEDPLPPGPFDLVASALAVHHLEAGAKADLFARVREALAPQGRFVLGDVVVPRDPRDAVTSLTDGFDRPSSAEEQLEWLAAAGFDASVVWHHRDLAVIVADAVGAADIVERP